MESWCLGKQKSMPPSRLQLPHFSTQAEQPLAVAHQTAVTRIGIARPREPRPRYRAGGGKMMQAYYLLTS